MRRSATVSEGPADVSVTCFARRYRVRLRFDQRRRPCDHPAVPLRSSRHRSRIRQSCRREKRIEPRVCTLRRTVTRQARLVSTRLVTWSLQMTRHRSAYLISASPAAALIVALATSVAQPPTASALTQDELHAAAMVSILPAQDGLPVMRRDKPRISGAMEVAQRSRNCHAQLSACNQAAWSFYHNCKKTVRNFRCKPMFSRRQMACKKNFHRCKR